MSDEDQVKPARLLHRVLDLCDRCRCSRLRVLTKERAAGVKETAQQCTLTYLFDQGLLDLIWIMKSQKVCHRPMRNCPKVAEGRQDRQVHRDCRDAFRDLAADQGIR